MNWPTCIFCSIIFICATLISITIIIARMLRDSWEDGE